MSISGLTPGNRQGLPHAVLRSLPAGVIRQLPGALLGISGRSVSASMGPVHLVLDGRIDDRPALARALGVVPAPAADLLLHAYRRWGRELARHISGEFAFALWDSGERRLLLGRDVSGTRPLHYTVRSGEVRFASEPRTLLAGTISGLDIHYDLGEGHPLLGRRMPDLDLVTSTGPVRVFSLLHRAEPVLLTFGGAGSVAIAPWTDRVRLIEAGYSGPWELPVLGAVTAPTAVLIRPDGYVAWVGDGTDSGLVQALETWFGAP